MHDRGEPGRGGSGGGSGMSAPGDTTEAVIMGVDLACFGSHQTVIAVRRGGGGVMIAWYWLISAFCFGGFFGIVLMVHLGNR